MFIGDWLGRRNNLTPHKVALIDTISGRKITYRAWFQQMNRTAHFLADALGVVKGDRVAVLAANSVEYLDTWLALGVLGGIMQNLNWRLAVPELERVLLDAAPKVLIYSGEFAGQVNALRGRLSSIQHYVALDTQADATDRPFSEREAYPDTPPPSVELSWDDPWVLCYTGGTTGLPKGAVLTHGCMTANSVNTVVSWGLTSDDVAPLISPLFHTGGLNVYTLPLVHVGGTTVVTRGWDTDQILDLVDARTITLFFAVPAMFVMMQAHPRWDRTDFSHLKYVINGGAPCPMPVFEKWWAKGVPFKTGYGLTEAGPNTFWLPPEDVQRKPGSVGHPLFHVDVTIVDPQTGQPCGPDEVGELLIRGPHVCAGYWRNPAATAETFRPTRAHPDGPTWLHTGDLARCDAEGYYYIVGRSKDMIISGGENIYPAEVESVMHAHPAVAAAALIGVPDEKWGEVGRAVVVLKPGETLSADDLLAYLREHLARYKVPKSVAFVAELPLTAAGKVDKKALRE
ncbi:MAG: long-chain fatty acid--CoA ligase [Anaerolineae bacterium CG2_30_64_16]|nr:MAG: long-chain fatty acid--CoA ligase [Anaerolineae bacterium CG2_30_64_16]